MENFSTNAQISKIGEVLADCICENYLEFDVLTGMAYHGISFSAMAASVLYNKYEQFSCKSLDQIKELIGFWMVG